MVFTSLNNLIQETKTQNDVFQPFYYRGCLKGVQMLVLRSRRIYSFSTKNEM